MLMKSKLLLILLVVLSLSLMGCTQSIEKVTSTDNYVDKKVSISGTASTPIKLGSLSGYTLEDKAGDKIIVAASDLPDEGEKVVARGTLKKGLLGIGYYVDTN